MAWSRRHSPSIKSPHFRPSSHREGRSSVFQPFCTWVILPGARVHYFELAFRLETKAEFGALYCFLRSFIGTRTWVRRLSETFARLSAESR